MNQLSMYYKHSGNMGPMGIVYMILIGIVGTVILSAIYGYAIFYIPFIYLNFFITLGFGAILGFLISQGAKWGKVRNNKVLYLFGFGFGLLAEYAGWVAWIYAFTDQKYFVTNLSGMWNLLGLIAEKGAWTIFGWTPTGFALYATWVIEGLMIIGGCTVLAGMTLSGIPFCERCNRWVEEKHTVYPLEPIEDPETFKTHVEQGDLSQVLSLKKPEGEGNYFTQIDLTQCSKCQTLHLMTVNAVSVTVDDKGEEKEDSDTIIENLIIDSQTYGKIQSMK